MPDKNKGGQKKDNSPLIDNYMNSVRRAESGGNDRAKASTSSATGRYQFTDDTWKAMEKRLGRKLNITNGKDQDAAMRELTSINADLLNKHGIPVNNSNLYMMHFLGIDGGPKFLKGMNENPNELASKFMSSKAAKANKSLLSNNGRPVTAAELFNKMAKKVSGPTVTPQQQRQQQTAVDFEPAGPVVPEMEIDNTRIQQPRPPVGANPKQVIDYSKFNFSNKQDENRQALGLIGDEASYLSADSNLVYGEEEQEEQALTDDEVVQNAKYGGTQYALGGLMDGPGDGDPTKPKPQAKPSMKAGAHKVAGNQKEMVQEFYKKKGFKEEVDPETGKATFTKEIPNSRHYKITGYHPGVTRGSDGMSGAYVYSPEADSGREFIYNKNLEDLHNSNEWKAYQAGLKAQNQPFIDAGMTPISNMYLDKSNQLTPAMLEAHRAKILNQQLTSTPGAVAPRRNGGQLDTRYEDGGALTEFNEGGKHEENELGGIPQGMNADGGLNTVEEGESKFNDYVLSDSLKLNEDDLENGFLPKEIKPGMTFSEAAKTINGYLKNNPNDKILKKTVEKHLDSLTLLNEKARLAKEELDMNQQGALEAPDGQEELAIGMNEMADGGDQNPNSLELSNSLSSTTGTLSGMAGGYGNAVAAVPGVIDLGKDFFGKPKVDNRNLNVNTAGNVGSGALKGAATGAMLGSVIPGVGTVIGGAAGAVVGAAAGFVKSGKQKKEATKQRGKNINEISNMYKDPAESRFELGGLMTNNKRARGYDNQYAHGGEIHQYQDGEDLGSPGTGIDLVTGLDWSKIGQQGLTQAPTDYMSNRGGSERPLLEAANPEVFGMKELIPQGEMIPQFESSPKQEDKTKEKKFKPKGISPAQYAGALGSALNFLEDRKAKPESERLNRLSNRYVPGRLDKEYLQNKQSEEYNNTLRALQEASEGSGGRMASNILAANINQIKGTSDAAFEMDKYANTEAEKQYQYDLNVDQANNQTDIMERDINARRKAAVEDRKRASRDSLLRDIGAIGREQTQSNRLYNVTGGYDRQGRYTPEEQAEINSILNADRDVSKEGQTKRYGGILSDYYDKSINSYANKRKKQEEEFNNYYR